MKWINYFVVSFVSEALFERGQIVKNPTREFSSVVRHDGIDGVSRVLA